MNDAHVEIRDASVSYFLRKSARAKEIQRRGAVGAPIVVGKRYLEVQALNDISLSLKTGDRVGLVGINGSGKSTLLKLCAGALAVQSGTISVRGKISPQFALGSGIKPDLTGRLNAKLKCLYMGIPQSRITEYVEEVKELSGLGGYFELPIRSYSAGMRSRLIMSLMRLVRGDIIVMDEWISAADASVNKTISRLQSDLINSASIVIMASHSQRILEDWVNQLIWIHQGQIRGTGPVKQVYSEYMEWMKNGQP